MPSFLFLSLALFTVLTALGMVFSRNAVNGAMCLLLCLAGVAGLFVALDAFLLAFLLILVYAGAIVALFLFIVMLLDVRGQDATVRRRVSWLAGAVAAGLLGTGLWSLVRHLHRGLPNVAAIDRVGAPLGRYAELLFTTYLLPVQVMGFLLLMAMLGVIVLSQRTEPAKDRTAASP